VVITRTSKAAKHFLATDDTEQFSPEWAQGIATVSGVGKQGLSFPGGGCY